ncbi:MAG TPA: 3-deoxy-D-manno-octulosonic acid transferase, partial [Terriglobales bacterium]|nr:3-deoxy-D-manno-octulosonic acid transferase [Terriglobales bacterium]
AFRGVLRTHPKALLMLAPRRPERFDEAFALVREAGLRCVRRSAWQSEPADGKGKPKSKLSGSVLLLDSIGELAALYKLATIALVGGSLEPRGGHNILEPAQFGVPVVVGPHMENFRDIMSTFAENKAVLQLEKTSAGAIERCLLALLQDTDRRQAMGAAALDVLRRQQGATARTLHALKPFLESTAQ